MTTDDTTITFNSSSTVQPSPEVASKIAAQNKANEAAGLPPVSTDLATPTPTPESDLGPLYPKMTDIVSAVTDAQPIPVADNVVSAEKPEPADQHAASDLRRYMDTVAETVDESTLR